MSGVAAAVEFGGLLQPLGGEADLYVAVEIHEQLVSLVAAVPDQLGTVVIRSVPADIWTSAIAEAKSVPGRIYAPRAAVALDLMESGNQRHWVAAENLIETRA